MPELPEVERARGEIAARALNRRIAAVDDTDAYVCRPHPPGEIAAALAGRRLTAAHRLGKAMWCETDGDAPDLGLHLGMAGRILVLDGEERTAWDRFTLHFEDGGRLVLRDKRRLGRAVLDPDLRGLGPDARGIGRDELATRMVRGTAPVKARLMDQAVVAGVGNLLADETLWRARLSPLRPASSLTPDEVGRLHRALAEATEDAVRLGGVHTGRFVPHRERGGHCPRCGTALTRARVGGRTTWWCPAEQD